MPKLFDFDDIPNELKGEAKVLIDAALAQNSSQSKPQMIHMCGIPGSGKTTYTTEFLQNNQNFSLVQFDTVMESLSGYQKERAEFGIEQAFSHWELPARVIGYHLLQALVDAQRNIFFDHSATNRNHIELISAIKNRGYLVEMHFIECSVAEATRRVIAREGLLQRHTPLGLIGERYLLLEELLPQYRLLVDKFIKTTA